MCIKEDAHDWVKMIHEYQVPHLIKEDILIQVHKGPYWNPTISLEVEHVINECKTCQITFEDKEAHDWR